MRTPHEALTQQTRNKNPKKNTQDRDKTSQSKKYKENPLKRNRTEPVEVTGKILNTRTRQARQNYKKSTKTNKKTKGIQNESTQNNNKTHQTNRKNKLITQLHTANPPKMSRLPS